ncbi:MAG: hypothetical protein RQ826_16215 [Xanthomonadales bacterium]|nr:hypothetical protein [Xanthomonadales bacterium]
MKLRLLLSEDELEQLPETVHRWLDRFGPFEVRTAVGTGPDRAGPGAPFINLWFKLHGRVGSDQTLAPLTHSSAGPVPNPCPCRGAGPFFGNGAEGVIPIRGGTLVGQQGRVFRRPVIQPLK